MWFVIHAKTLDSMTEGESLSLCVCVFTKDTWLLAGQEKVNEGMFYLPAFLKFVVGLAYLLLLVSILLYTMISH